MGIALWVLWFLVATVVSAWVVLGNGAETVAAFVFALWLGADTSRWSDQAIRLFVGLSWVLLAVWFVLGLFEPALRL
jgi:hypothetical protein